MIVAKVVVLVVCKKKSDYAPVVQIFAVLHADAADMERDCRLQAQAVEQKAADNTTKTKNGKNGCCVHAKNELDT